MAFCETTLNDTFCESPHIDDPDSSNGSCRTTCVACGLSSCRVCSGIVTRAEANIALGSEKGAGAAFYIRRRVCNDCRSQNGLPLVGDDYGKMVAT